ncbi:DUF3467 domain-containing protein [Lacimonas salitolerans]|uniref:DUF3467 domain-containing protein n=1 Tax=Lacimonas salitolerans TaxID=1323750 RepID=A0ABW4EGX2_9RHOB
MTDKNASTKLDIENAEVLGEQTQEGAARNVQVRFDDTNMQSNYANVANVGMSKDELTLLFGVNQTWGTVGDEIVIKLSSRIILTPSVAKNLSETLKRVLSEYEEKVGKII